MSRLKILQFKAHQGDPLSGIIREVTDGQYTHTAILIDPATNKICEAYFPEVRFRCLADSELAGIDVYDIPALTAAQEQAVINYCAAEVANHEKYSILNLGRFLPIVRAIIGEAKDDPDVQAKHNSVFCTQFAFDALNTGAGYRLLNANSWDLAPNYITWSTLLVPNAALKPVQAMAPPNPLSPPSQPSMPTNFPPKPYAGPTQAS